MLQRLVGQRFRLAYLIEVIDVLHHVVFFTSMFSAQQVDALLLLRFSAIPRYFGARTASYTVCTAYFYDTEGTPRMPADPCTSNALAENPNSSLLGYLPFLSVEINLDRNMFFCFFPTTGESHKENCLHWHCWT